MIQTLEWTDAGVRFIDQRKLPMEEVYVTSRTYQEVAEAISTMVVRGAPAIGVAGAMGVALGMKAAAAAPGMNAAAKAKSAEELRPALEQISATLAATRPTAVNLFWGIRRMKETFEANAKRSVAEMVTALVREAQQMHAEDIDA